MGSSGCFFYRLRVGHKLHLIDTLSPFPRAKFPIPNKGKNPNQNTTLDTYLEIEVIRYYKKYDNKNHQLESSFPSLNLLVVFLDMY